MKQASFIVTIIIFMTTMSSGCLENGFFGSEKDGLVLILSELE